MRAQAVTPILDVSDMQQSFDWFKKIGWQKGCDWNVREMHIRHPDGHVFRVSCGLEPG